MRVFAYVMLGLAMIAGYVGPIVTGVVVAGTVGGSVPLFPDIRYFWPAVFGMLAATGAITPAIIAEKLGIREL